LSRIEINQTIAAPPRHVFAFFVPQRMPYWYGTEMQSCFEVQDGASDFSLGLKVRISGTLARRTVSHTAVITNFEPARLLEWRFQDAHGVRGLERWDLESALPENGDSSAARTIVHFVADYQMPGFFGRLLDALISKRAVFRRSAEQLGRLAAVVERRRPDETSK
jgi:uncharacterized protein YndB with AHSA1/START domain